MSTAVIISGQMRTFARCYPTQRWMVYRHYQRPEVRDQKSEDPHFFVSCLDDNNAESAELLRKHYANVHIEKWHDPQDLPEVPIEYGAHAPYANAAGHAQLMLQHWGNKKAWEFFESEIGDQRSEVSPAPVFNTIIRMRPDNFFHRFTPPFHNLMDDDALTPWWGKFGGINDRFAIMGYKAAKAYFNTYDKITELLAAGCPFHPESLVAASLLDSNISIFTNLMTAFSTLRISGEQRWPEITSDDVAELISDH